MFLICLFDFDMRDCLPPPCVLPYTYMFGSRMWHALTKHVDGGLAYVGHQVSFFFFLFPSLGIICALNYTLHSSLTTLFRMVWLAVPLAVTQETRSWIVRRQGGAVVGYPRGRSGRGLVD